LWRSTFRLLGGTLGVPLLLAALVADAGAGLIGGGGGAPFADLALRNNSRPSSINLLLSWGPPGLWSLLRVALASSPRFRSSARSFDVNGLLRGDGVFALLRGDGVFAVVSSCKPLIERATLCGWVLGLAVAAGGFGAGAAGLRDDGAFGVDLGGAKVGPSPFGTLLAVALGRGGRGGRVALSRFVCCATPLATLCVPIKSGFGS
jgi:hypothetical protein